MLTRSFYVPEEPFPVSPGPAAWIYPAAESSNWGISRELASVSADGSLLEYRFAKVPSFFLARRDFREQQGGRSDDLGNVSNTALEYTGKDPLALRLLISASFLVGAIDIDPPMSDILASGRVTSRPKRCISTILSTMGCNR